jgi:ABC-type spermidine/putrescine transport system permease subunit II
MRVLWPWIRGARAGTWGDRSLVLWTAAVFAFLFAPIVTTVVYSFNKGALGRQTANFVGFTTRWYGVAWNDAYLRDAVVVSLKVAAASAVLSTGIGAIIGFMLARHTGRVVRSALEGVVYLLIIVPEVVLAVSLLLFFSKAGVTLGMATLVAGHTPFGIAVVALIVRSRAVALDRTIEEAVRDLGAGSLRTFVDVVLPQMRPALLAGLIMAFTFSFDDLITSEFLSTPTVTTLPVYIFGSVKTGVVPSIYATASVMLAVTLTGLLTAMLVYRQQDRLLRRSPRRTRSSSAGAAVAAIAE